MCLLYVSPYPIIELHKDPRLPKITGILHGLSLQPLRLQSCGGLSPTWDEVQFPGLAGIKILHTTEASRYETKYLQNPTYESKCLQMPGIAKIVSFRPIARCWKVDSTAHVWHPSSATRNPYGGTAPMPDLVDWNIASLSAIVESMINGFHNVKYKSLPGVQGNVARDLQKILECYDFERVRIAYSWWVAFEGMSDSEYFKALQIWFNQVLLLSTPTSFPVVSVGDGQDTKTWSGWIKTGQRTLRDYPHRQNGSFESE